MKTPQRSKGLALRPLKIPARTDVTLSNGLKVTLVPRGPLPLAAVRLVVSTGAAHDPVDRKGVSDFAARLMRRGAGGKSADEISEAVELVGASVSAWAGEDAFGVGLNTPSKHLSAMLPIFADVALRPDYPDKEVELSRRRTLAQLSNDLDDPGSLADRALTRSMFGGHPYGVEVSGTRRDVETISRADLLAFHQARLSPKNSHLYLVGELDAGAALKQLEDLFGAWQTPLPQLPVIPDWPAPAKRGAVVIVDKPEQTQVQVRIAGPGVKRGHPDHFALMVMNTVLGGGFTSRLVREIRVKRGLSYGAGSHFDMLKAAGGFTVSSFTKTQSLTTLVDIALAEVKKMKTKGPSQTEVETVQRYISGLYPARLETNEAVAGAISDVDFYGLDEQWISQYRERICAVSAKQAAEVASRRLFEPADSVLVLVGNAKELEPQVQKYGSVQVLQPKDLE